MRDRIVSELRRSGRFPEALSAILGRPVSPRRTTAIRCPNAAAHANGDRSESAIVKPRVGRVDCAACGAAFGILELGIALGHGRTPPEVAEWLREQLAGLPSRKRRDPVEQPARKWARSLDAARRTWARGRAECPESADRAARAVSLDPDGFDALGGGVRGRRGACEFVLAVHDKPNRPCGLKLRRDPPFKFGERTTRTMLARGSSPGLIGLPSVTAIRGKLGAFVVLCEGESDLCALVGELRRSRVTNVAAVSPSHGVRQRLDLFGQYLRGLPVAIVFDEDDAGREGAAQAVRDLRPYVPSPRVVRLPFRDGPTKDTNDLRAWLDGEGSVRELLRLIEGREPAPAGLFSFGARP